MTEEGRLHGVSEAIGQLRAGVAGVRDTLDRHCIDDDRRHKENLDELHHIREVNALRHHENIAALGEMRRSIDKLTDGLVKPLAETVKAIQPVVTRLDRWSLKIGTAIALAASLLAVLGWVIEQGVANLLHWFWTRPH
jgi:hypothetical protein